MGKKIIAVVIIAVLVIAAVGVYFFIQNKDKNNEINVIAAANTNGSGIYADPSRVNISDMFTLDDHGDLVPVASGWENKVFGTPGMSTIQHIQLLQLVTGMGMNFSLYKDGESNNAPNTVYYDPGVPNATTALSDAKNYIDGGILWQPQFQKIVDNNRFKELVLTNDLWSGHACCCIAGSNDFLTSNTDLVVNFLAAYIKAVNWVNNALAAGAADPSDADYQWLVREGISLAGPNFTEKEIKEAMATVTYTYGDSDNIAAPLTTLTGQVGTLAEQLEGLGKGIVLNNTLSDLGFKSGTAFANKFVNGSYLAQAIRLTSSGTPVPPSSGLTNITVAVISGDIHQIAVHVAQDLPESRGGGPNGGFFGEYGLNVTFSPQVNGPGVATAVQNGNSVLGIMGAPPITITVINGELVTA